MTEKAPYIDPTIAWEERIRYLQSLSRAEYISLLITDVESALAQVPEATRRSSLVLQLLKCRLHRQDLHGILTLRYKEPMNAFPEVQKAIREDDIYHHLKTKVLVYRVLKRANEERQSLRAAT